MSDVETSEPGRVLLVDDDPLVQRALARMLRGAGFAVQLATDGPHAVALLGSAPFDVVLTDIRMPGMDGIELLRKVRAFDAELPVILITADPSVDTAVQAIEQGVTRYLIKPCDTVETQEALREAIRVRRSGAFRREALAIAQRNKAADEASLGRAISSIAMVYQPIVSWKRRTVSGYEALLRSNEPSLPHAALLLAAADGLGRIVELGKAVRAAVAARLEMESTDADFFVNLHAKELSDEALYAGDAPLSRHARRIVLEVTERASLEEVHDLEKRLERLRKMGYRIALDDLGAGYAGLSSFLALQPDVVKLDMTLVRNIHRDPLRRGLVAMMVKLCREMNTPVVVEGVESVEERDSLIELDCDLMQGYLFARPELQFPLVSW